MPSCILSAGVANSAPRLNRSFWMPRRRASKSVSALSARAKPMAELNSSTVPIAQTRAESLLTRLPPASPVVPSSPVRVTILVSRGICYSCHSERSEESGLNASQTLRVAQGVSLRLTFLKLRGDQAHELEWLLRRV